MSNSKEKRAFWITNASQRDVSLGDLNLTVRAHSSINLLDERHYHLTEEQVTKSAESGSIWAKRTKIFVRKVPPQSVSNKSVYIMVAEGFIPDRSRSAIPVIQPQYEELNLTDESFAEQNFDSAEQDIAPILPKKA